MATQNLLDVIKAWPQKTTLTAPKKTPELFVPSKVSDTPSNKNSLVSLLKTSTPSVVFESTWLTKIAKESLPIEILNTTWKIIKESSTKFKNSKPTSNSLVSNLIDSSKWVIWPLWETLWQRMQRPKQTQNTIWDVLNKVWNWSISPLWAATEIWVTLWWEAIWLMPVVALTDFAVNYALNATDTKKAYDWFIWLWQNKVSEILQKWFWISKDKADNYTNIWVWLTNFIGWSKWWNIQNKWWTSNIIKWAALQEAPNLALLTIWLASEWEWKKIDFQKWLWWSALSAIVWWWAITPNIKNTNSIIPDNKTTKINEAKLDTELSEKASRTKTTKLSPEDAKIYPDYMKNKKDWESFIEYKARINSKDTKIPLIEEIKKQPKLKEQFTSQQKIDTQDALYKVLNRKEYDKINLPKKDIVNINDYWKAHDNFMYWQWKELPTVRVKGLIDEDLKISLWDTIKIYARWTEWKMVTGEIEDIVVNNWNDFVVKIKDINWKIYYTEPRLLSNIKEIKPKPTLQQTIESKNKQPEKKIEKRTDKPTTKTSTQELSDLQKQKTDLEKRVKNKPQLQRVLNQVNKKISDLESKIKEQPQRLQKSELFPEEAITPEVENIVNPIREKLTKKRAKEIKKAIFDELAERRKIRADKIKQEQNIIKTEEQKIKQNQELIQDNRRKELEEIYLKTDNSKDFEDIVYNDNILSDDNKIKLLEEVQELETMKTWKSNVEIKKEWIPETWDIFATPEEKVTQQKLDATKNLQDIISADINKSPDIKFELWVIQQWLQKIPWVREVLKSWWKLFIDIRNKLNNVMVITKEWLQWLWDVITWIWNRKKQIVEQSIKDFWISDLANWSTKNSKELIQVRKILEKNLKEIYTTDWKFDEVWYNNAKSLLNEQYFESIFKNSNLDNLRFISEVYFRDKNFNKWSKLLLDLLPDNIKTKLKELDEKVSVKYDEEWNVLNPWSLEHEMTTVLWEYLEDIWLLRYKKDWYKRWVITKEMYDFLKKHQKDLWLEDIPEFQEFIKKRYDTTLQQTWDIPKWMSSILKKSKNMEKYHIQDPITRMISYADEVWQLISNKETVDIINSARKAWKDINQYIWKEADDFARKALWLHDVWIKWKIAWKVSWWLWATAIIWSLPIMAMSGWTTLNRATPVFLKPSNLLWLNIWNINKTIDFLEKSWIEQKFINETWLDKIVWANYSIFWWGAFDKRVKWFLWSMIIKNQLDSLWVKLWKWDNLIEVYQNTLNKLPIEQSNKLISDIWRQLNDLSDFSNLSRWQIHWLDSRIFNTFKNFWRTTTSRYLSYPTQVVNEVYSSMKNWLSKSDLTDRSYQKIAFLLADTLWVYLWAKLIVDKLLPQEDEEKKEILANKLSWWSIKDKLSMLLSYPLQQPWISMISSTFNNIVKLVEDISNNWLQKDQIDYTKISWLVRQLSLLMKDKELTSWWTYKYNNEWSDNTIQNTLKFILWFSDWRLDYEVAKKNIDKIQEWDKWLVSSVVDKIISDQNFFYSWLWEPFDIAKYALWDRDTKNDFYNFTVRSQSKKNLDTLLSNIKSWEKVPMTAEEWIANAWNWFDIKAEDKDIMWFMKNNLTSNKTAQKELLKVINEVWINNDPLYKWDMNQYMEQLKTKNPALFYQIIKKVINPIIIKIDKDKKTLKDLQYTWSEAWTSFVDEILVDRFENLPRIASDIANRFDKIISENPTDEELSSYNELIKTTQKLPYLWDDITDSLSTVVWKRLKWIEWIRDKLDLFPELQNALKQAAILRGIKFKNNTNENNLVDNIKNIWQTISGDEKIWLQTQTWYAPQKKKSELVELLKLEVPKKKYEPLFKTQQWPTLTEILLRK